MKKKITLVATSVLLVAALVIGGTLAYFTDTEEATNTFTVGNVDITLTEPNWNSSGSTDAPEAYPGEALAKDPTVTNVGANPCFVAIKVEWPTVSGITTPVTYRTDYVNGKLGDNWVLYKNVNNYSLFYYNIALGCDDATKTTDALFDQIVISQDFENGDAQTGYNVVVTAYALQAQGIISAKWSDVSDGVSDSEFSGKILPVMKTEFARALDMF